MKKALYLICGFCWFLFGLGFGFFLLRYLADGAGLQALTSGPVIFGQPITAGSIMTGLMQGTGLFLASAFCLFVGLGLCSHGLGLGRDSKR
jgi:hypothetical protein